MFVLKKKFKWLIADFEIKEELNHKHVNHLEKIPTKHINMAYINCEQDHIDNNIRHIFIKKHAMNNTNISIKRKEK